jgi:hypothetical protein
MTGKAKYWSSKKNTCPKVHHVLFEFDMTLDPDVYNEEPEF